MGEITEIVYSILGSKWVHLYFMCSSTFTLTLWVLTRLFNPFMPKKHGEIINRKLGIRGITRMLIWGPFILLIFVLIAFRGYTVKEIKENEHTN